MSIELSRDASRLIEDIELELASIRAAMALRPLEPSQHRPLVADSSAEPPVPAVRRIGPFDLTRTGADATAETPVTPDATASDLAISQTSADPDDVPKRMTLQQRLASLQDED